MKILSIFLSVLLLTSLFVIIGGLGSGSTATVAYADEEQLLEKIPVGSASTANAAGPTGDVFAASGNNRFVAWFDSTPGNYDIFFRRSTDNGANWQPTVNLSNNLGPSVNPRIEVSGSNVYVVWSQQNADISSADIYVRISADNGATWGGKVKISTSGTNFYASPQITALGSNVFITWNNSTAADIFFRRSTDNGATWKPIINISNNAGTAYLPQIAVSGSNVYVTWYDSTPGDFDILFRRSTDNGATWKSIVNISNNAGGSYVPQIAVSGSNVYVTWSDVTTGDSEILLRRSTDNGATWKAVKDLSNNVGNSYNPEVAASGSNVYVTWFDDTPGNYDSLLKRSTDNGATWKAVKNLSNNAGYSYIPQIAVSGSNLYITWTDDTTGNYEILLRRSTDNGATLQPLVQISNNAGTSRNSQVTTVGSDVYIMWEDNTPGNFDILSRRSADNGSTWKTVKNLSSNAGGSYFIFD